MKRRMKKMSLLLCSLFLICNIIGCQKPQPNEDHSTPPVSQPEEILPNVPPEPEATTPVFKPGTWMAQGEERGEYYFFDADGISGRTASYETGTGLGFTYAQRGDETIFHMGASDVSRPCKVVVTDETHITLEWDVQNTETLTFLSPLDAQHFHFYTHEELCQLALDDYTAKYSPSTELTAAAADNGDGTVTIQLYQSLGGHNSTAAWYRIDRVTGEGQDVNLGFPVDLTNGSPDMDITYLDPASQLVNYYECTADASAYQSKLLLSPEVPVTAFRVVLLEYTESPDTGIGFRITKELFAADNMTPEKPLILNVTLPETIPNTGITYVDRNGDTRLYAISESGLNGTPLLLEEHSYHK